MSDLAALQAAVAGLPAALTRWHAGDLAWSWATDPVADRDVRAWDAAWAWVDPPGDLSACVGRSAPGLADEVVAWAVRDHDVTSATVLDTETHLAEALSRNGFRPDEDAPFFLRMVVDLADLPAVALPDGFTARAVRDGEAAARAAVHRAAWAPARVGGMLVPPRELTGASGYTDEVHARVAATTPYRPDLDRVVVADDGTFAACALAWLDQDHVGLLEPVGCDPSYAGLGLGAAASLDALHALRAAGATTALVGPRGDDGYPVPRRVYARLGFRPVARTVTWVRG